MGRPRLGPARFVAEHRIGAAWFVAQDWTVAWHGLDRTGFVASDRLGTGCRMGLRPTLNRFELYQVKFTVPLTALGTSTQLLGILQ